MRGVGPSLILTIAASTAGAQCEEQLPTWGDSSLQSCLSLAVADHDGPGPLQPTLVAVDATTTTAAQVVQWNGTTWATLGTGFSGTSYGVMSFDGDASGPDLPSLFRAGSWSTQGLQRLSGTTWVAAGTPRPPTFYTFCFNGIDQPDPEAPALFTLGDSAVLRWTGSDWVNVSGVFWYNNLRVPELLWWDRDGIGPAPADLVLGTSSSGSFVSPAAFDGTSWRQVGNSLGFSSVKGLGTHDPDGPGPIPPQLMLGTSNDLPGRVRRLANGVWTALGAGVVLSPPGSATDEGVHAFLDFDPDGEGPQPPELWIAGGFSLANGQPAKNFARWRFVTPPPAFVQFAADTESCVGETAQITTSFVGASSVAWQMLVQGTWTALGDGPLVIGGNEVGGVQGATTPTLFITWTGAPTAVSLRAVLASACGSTTGNVVALTIDDCPAPCDADVNCDGAADAFDIEALEQAMGGDMTNFCQTDADFNRDGSVDGFDVESIEQVIAGAPCP
jgi:hypothetical protein